MAKLSSDNLEKDKTIRRQEKTLSEAATLLILSKKAQAIWGGQGRMISSQDRKKALELINKAIAQGVCSVKACKYLGIAFSTYLKWLKDPKAQDGRPGAQRIRNHRALTETERQAVIERYCQPDVCDLSIRQVFHKLLDNGMYLASESTNYRIFRKLDVNVRRDGPHALIKTS